MSIPSLISKTIESAKIELIHPVLDYINDVNDYRKFVFTILFKLANGLESVNLLNAQLNNKSQYADTIFISLRALLADRITMDFLLFKSGFKAENTQDQLEWIKYDHIKYTIDNLKTFQSIYGSSNEEIEHSKTDLKSKFPNYFDDDGNLKKSYKTLPSIGNMVKEIIAGTRKHTVFQQRLISCYQYYDIYSKYEHLGQLTSHLVFRGYKPSEQESISIEIHSCLHLLMDFMSELLTEFHETDTIENTEYWKNNQKLMSKLT